MARPQGGRGRTRAGAEVARHRASPAGREARSTRRSAASSSTTAASLAYDYLVIATGPELAFDEIEGLGPEANTQSVCHDRPRAQGEDRGRRAGRQSRPGGHRRGAGRLLLRPGLRVRLHPRQGAARRQGARPGADDLRHLGALHRPSRPRRRRRHQGPARERAAPAPHQVDHATPASTRSSPSRILVSEIAEDGSGASGP